MQAKGIHVEPLFSNPGNPNNTTALMETIVKLKQDVKLCQQEKNAVVEQLNCLISLIKRSWTGDNNASLHLANIVGLPPPEFDYRATHLNNTPVPDKSTRAAMLWERLSIKLLDRNYAEIQEEIRERQMLFMQNRQLYMDEVLHHHQMEMSKTPVRKNSKTYEEVDRKFIHVYSKDKIPTPKSHTIYKQLHNGVMTARCDSRSSTGTPRSKQGGKMQRIKSAPPRSRTAKDLVNGTNIKMKDLFVSNGQPQIPLSEGKDLHIVNSGPSYIKERERIDYDDPQRYGQKNLFDLDAVFGPDSEKRKPQRPFSAYVPRGQQSRSRPQSGHGAFITQKSERPMKYESTRPVSGKIQHKKTSSQRLRSGSEPNLGPKIFMHMQSAQESHPTQQVEEDGNVESDKDKTDINNVEYDDSDSDFDFEEYNKPPVRVRVESAPPKRPAHVDKFAKELLTMEEMERDFKKSAIQLQKKIGIDLHGMVS